MSLMYSAWCGVIQKFSTLKVKQHCNSSLSFKLIAGLHFALQQIKTLLHGRFVLQGQFGCYKTTCVGVTVDITISAGYSQSWYNSWGDFAGTAYVRGGGGGVLVVVVVVVVAEAPQALRLVPSAL